MAHALVHVLREEGYSTSEMRSILEGCELPNTPLSRIAGLASIPGFLDRVDQAMSNLRDADVHFAKLRKRTDYQEIASNTVAIKIIEPGSGKQLLHRQRALVDYSILSPQGSMISSAKHQWVHPDTIISGLWEGMQGMRMGETREIHIHPSHGYGIATPSDKAIHLLATVRLNGLDSEICESQDSRATHDLNPMKSVNWRQQLVEINNQALKSKGSQLGEFLRQSKHFNAADAIQLAQMHLNDPEFKKALSEDELNVYLNVCLDIYLQKENSTGQ